MRIDIWFTIQRCICIAYQRILISQAYQTLWQYESNISSLTHKNEGQWEAYVAVFDQTFMWKFRSARWNITQNCERIYRKIFILQRVKNLANCAILNYDILSLTESEIEAHKGQHRWTNWNTTTVTSHESDDLPNRKRGNYNYIGKDI